MKNTIVCKFGGSSLADAGQIEKVRNIVSSNSNRRVVVVSAPGRSQSDEQKVTDHLINIATRGRHFREQRLSISPKMSQDAIIKKFETILDKLDLKNSDVLAGLRRDFETDLEGDKRIAFLASRGEHYNARIIAAYFAKTGMKAVAQLPEDFGFRVDGHYLDAKVTEEAYRNIAEVDLDEEGIIIVPGYYGVTENGDVAVFSRGGSDLTGGELAYAFEAHTYENWTDVSGVFEMDPGVVPEAQAIPRLTFKELRLLSSKGFNVFHLDAMLRCKERKIPIRIGNTNKPEEQGTLILNERVPEEGVVGIARLDNVAYIYLEKDMLGEEVGFTATLLSLFQEFGINTYHYPTDKDDIAVLVNQDDLLGSINDLRREIERKLTPDFMDVEYNISILTPVGLGLKGNSYPIVDALSTLSNEHIPIEMIHESPSQICFHIGVRQAVADDALTLLYDTLIKNRPQH